MRSFQLKLQTISTHAIGTILIATTKENLPFLGKPVAHFDTLAQLRSACERVGIPCFDWGGPDSNINLELTAEQLISLGFRLKQPFVASPQFLLAALSGFNGLPESTPPAIERRRFPRPLPAGKTPFWCN